MRTKNKIYLLIAASLIITHSTVLAGSFVGGQQAKSIVNNSVRVYPNPIKGNGLIDVDIIKEANIVVELFDLSGKKVKELAKQYIYSGKHQISFDSSDLKDGVYLCKISTEEWVEAKRVIIKH
jgi:hypothetical protein